MDTLLVCSMVELMVDSMAYLMAQTMVTQKAVVSAGHWVHW